MSSYNTFTFLCSPKTFTCLCCSKVFGFLVASKVFSFLEADARLVLRGDFCSKNKMGWVRSAFYS